MFFRRLHNVHIRQETVDSLLKASKLLRRVIFYASALRYYAKDNLQMAALCLLIDVFLEVIGNSLNAPEAEPEVELELLALPAQPNFVGIKFTKYEYQKFVIRILEEFISKTNRELAQNRSLSALITKRWHAAMLGAAMNTHTFKFNIPIEDIPPAKLVLMDNYFARNKFGVRKNPHTKRPFSFGAIQEFREIEGRRNTMLAAPQTMFQPTLRQRISKQLTIQTHTMKRKLS